MAEERYNIFRSTVHWRYAMARPNLLFFDARLVFFIGLFAFHIRWWTFATLIFVFAISGLAGASYFNYSLESLWRLIRSKVVGTFRPAIPHTRLRPMLDFGGDSLRELCLKDQLSNSPNHLAFSGPAHLKPAGEPDRTQNSHSKENSSRRAKNGIAGKASSIETG